MSDKELDELENDLRTDLQKLNRQRSQRGIAGGLGIDIDKTSQFKGIRKNIARILTIKNERKRGILI